MAKEARRKTRSGEVGRKMDAPNLPEKRVGPLAQEARRALRIYTGRNRQTKSGRRAGSKAWSTSSGTGSRVGRPASTHPKATVPERPGAGKSDADTLAWLAEQADGWWCWSTEKRGPSFVGMDEWLQRYPEWKCREAE